ncbi:hypothetical protein GIB67_029784 [Kingdonia uniflora]|uniref:PPM-type phosphatase domain-containing protein n=1 Tax=Kingdonia uniflora TaxID=39325 RepID=A0A7J7NJ04_9MAGN|nr:hypothetical protein GIB67_029784 [Kingdonia uniflora]
MPSKHNYFRKLSWKIQWKTLVKLVRQAAANTNDLVGDGTTTSDVPAQGLIAEDVKIGHLRCWPGGLCLSWSIGDMDVGEFIVRVPYVKQVKLSNTGERLIIASDDIWDAISSEMAAKYCPPAELASKQVVKEALRSRGLKDDIICIVVDIIPPDNSLPPSPPLKNQGKLRSLIFRKRSHDSASKLAKKLSTVGIVEELFEEGSAMLADRLVCWVFQKIGSHDDNGLQRFLDNVQYKCVGILHYEQVFGHDFVNSILSLIQV